MDSLDTRSVSKPGWDFSSSNSGSGRELKMTVKSYDRGCCSPGSRRRHQYSVEVESFVAEVDAEEALQNSFQASISTEMA